MITISSRAVIWGAGYRFASPIGSPPAGSPPAGSPSLPTELLYAEIRVDPTSLPETINIAASHPFDIDWGDGVWVPVPFADAYDDAVAPGPIRIRSNEQVDWVEFNPGIDNFDITHINIINSSSLQDQSNMCTWLQELQSFSMSDASNVTTFFRAFDHCDVLQKAEFGDGDMTSCTTFDEMFDGANLTHLQALTTSAGRTFARMFANNSELVCLGAIDTETAYIDAPGFDTTDMFLNCTSLVAPDGAAQLAIRFADVYVNPGACTSQQILTAPMTNPRDIATDGNGTWVMIGVNGINDASATAIQDKTVWAFNAQPFNAFPVAIETDSQGAWVVVDEIGDVWNSTNAGQTWQFRTSTSISTLKDIIYHSSVGKFYIVGDGVSGFESSDGGVTWASFTLGTTSGGVGATDGTQVTVAGVLISKTTSNGVLWTSSGLPSGTMAAAWYGDGHFVFTSTSPPLVHWNTTGTGSWTSTDPDGTSTTPLAGIFYIESESRWVTVDTSNNWYESTNLTSWSEITSGDFSGKVGGEKVAADEWGYILLQSDNNLLIKY